MDCLYFVSVRAGEGVTADTCLLIDWYHGWNLVQDTLLNKLGTGRSRNAVVSTISYRIF